MDNKPVGPRSQTIVNQESKGSDSIDFDSFDFYHHEGHEDNEGVEKQA